MKSNDSRCGVETHADTVHWELNPTSFTNPMYVMHDNTVILFMLYQKFKNISLKLIKPKLNIEWYWHYIFYLIIQQVVRFKKNYLLKINPQSDEF